VAGYDPKRARGRAAPAATEAGPADPGESPAPVDALLGGPSLAPAPAAAAAEPILTAVVGEPGPTPEPTPAEEPGPPVRAGEPDLQVAAEVLGAEAARAARPQVAGPAPAAAAPQDAAERGQRWVFLAFLAAVVVLVVLRLRQRALRS
jgi:hypothetical protein